MLTLFGIRSRAAD